MFFSCLSFRVPTTHCMEVLVGVDLSGVLPPLAVAARSQLSSATPAIDGQLYAVGPCLLFLYLLVLYGLLLFRAHGVLGVLL
jgi:hypothetical protein